MKQKCILIASSFFFVTLFSPLLTSSLYAGCGGSGCQDNDECYPCVCYEDCSTSKKEAKRLGLVNQCTVGKDGKKKCRHVKPEPKE